MVQRRRDLRSALRKSRIVHWPCHHKTIRPDPAVQGAGALPIHVPHVLRHAHAEHIDVEVCVARDEGVERPRDRRRANLPRGCSLRFFEPTAHAAVLRFGRDAEHVRPVHDGAFLNTSEPEDKADERAAATAPPRTRVESTEENATHPSRDLQNARRHNLREILTPDPTLQCDARAEVRL